MIQARSIIRLRSIISDDSEHGSILHLRSSQMINHGAAIHLRSIISDDSSQIHQINHLFQINHRCSELPAPHLESSHREPRFSLRLFSSPPCWITPGWSRLLEKGAGAFGHYILFPNHTLMECSAYHVIPRNIYYQLLNHISLILIL